MDDEYDRRQSGQSLIVASTLATLVLAGSAVLLRSKLPQLLALYGNDTHVADPNEERDTDVSNQAQNVPSKNSRSKERRRRGKDPLKELLKGGKKAKDIAKLLKTVDHGDANGASVPASPTATQAHRPLQLPELSPSRAKRSASPDPSVSSRSVSSASSFRQHVRIADVDHQHDSYEDSLVENENQDLHRADMVSKDLSDSQRPLRSDSHYTDSHYIYSTYSTAHSTPSHSHSTSHDSTPSLASAVTSFSSADSETSTSTAMTSVGSMSPVMHYNDEDLNPCQAQEDREQRKSTPTGSNIPSSKSYPSKSPKDYIHNASDAYHSSRKPPRFRTRNSPSSPQPDIPASASMPPIASRTSTSTIPSRSTDNSEQHTVETPVSVDFPTLNGAINSTVVNSRYGDRERTSSAVHVGDIDGHQVTMNDHGSSTRRAPTPRRTPTPSAVGTAVSTSGSGTGSPAPGSGVNSGRSTPPQSQSASSASSTLSTQTQIASLRGALEAARMREEKTKGELERYVKEVEMLRWEGSSWRRRESELQNHIHHLVHQLQSYTAFYMSSVTVQPPTMQSPPNGSQHLQHLAVPGRNGSPSGSNGGPNAPSPSPKNNQQVPLPPVSNTSGSQSLGHEPPPSVQENGSGMPTNGLMMQQVPSQTNPLPTSPISPLGTMSPLSFSMLPSPQSPHFPYPSYPMVGPSHVPGRSPYGVPIPVQMHPSHFLSMLNTMPTSTSLSSGFSMGSGEVPSPDPSVNNSPSPGPKERLDRGRKKTKAMASAMGELGDGWVGVGFSGDVEEENSASGSSERYDAEGEDDDDEDRNGGVSELLADAILKRPGSIRLGSGKKKGSRRDTPSSGPEDVKGNVSASPAHSSPGTPGSSGSQQNSSESPVEFVFPSISDWGNVTRKKADVTVSPTQGTAQALQEEATTKGPMGNDDITPPASCNAQVTEPSAIFLPDPVFVTGGKPADIDN